MGMQLDELKLHIREYVEIETGSNVLSMEYIQTFSFLGEEDVLFLCVTDDDCRSEWWVIGGYNLMNLYPKIKFNPTPDDIFMFHLGATMRMSEKGPQISSEPPEEIGYDAFICHASEDKENFVRPLSEDLRSMGFWVWYDEFTLEVGDSLRQSIDRGLASSRYGIVVLSPAFFEKNWPQYELNGLTAKEIDGQTKILPVWYNVTKRSVLNYSPPLADKVAVVTKGLKIKEVAKKLRNAIVKNE